MPPKSLNKVQKQVAKKKGRSAALHSNSRDSQRLRRAAARDDRLSKVISARAKANEHYLDRMFFFQQELQERVSGLSPAEMLDLVQNYIRRNDNELELVQSERRPGRPSSTREEAIRQQQKTESSELRSGFWIPDLQDESSLETFKEWNGEWVALGRLKFLRLNDDGNVTAGKFPPGRGE